ncbi:hypothetical protein ABW06_25620 [Pluralibacter gergoviae]|uniref:Uncharacterized protein n=1 Tax=Pluralibacter gergoviae TaxID=61647 RepID=A0A089PXV8_PLUGE|nr:hypothetical protein LG71_25520 [Pluralibacter gergoviae]KMK04714.1 hypothetical protein ABW06_25620 [Pluralibacter gergoviae]KMK15956.1 hypothetical protein ABW10_25185 [Pluralibacter gergoviae]KMK32466.1 hypothetical protein ABW12_12295 [Pluralibacter gergoviae]KMK41072.1 hypothetical protein ABW13_11085 [Pluralibacter gergoviae]
MYLQFVNLKVALLLSPDLIKLARLYSLEEKIQSMITGVYMMLKETLSDQDKVISLVQIKSFLTHTGRLIQDWMTLK